MWVIFVYVIGIILAGALIFRNFPSRDWQDTAVLGALACVWPGPAILASVFAGGFLVGYLLNKLFGRDS
jgi:hypothetical protein